MDLGIAGRVALVFGADSGIGWNTARLLLDEGATVIDRASFVNGSNYRVDSGSVATI